MLRRRRLVVRRRAPSTDGKSDVSLMAVSNVVERVKKKAMRASNVRKWVCNDGEDAGSWLSILRKFIDKEYYEHGLMPPTLDLDLDTDDDSAPRTRRLCPPISSYRVILAFLFVGVAVSSVVGGEHSVPTPTPQVSQWWDGFGSYTERGLSGPVQELILFNSDLIAGGWFGLASDARVNQIARWDGEGWHSLGTGISDCPGIPCSPVVLALGTYGSDLIAGGDFNKIDGVSANYIARWDGQAWHAMGEGMNEQVLAVIEWQGRLIAGGAFTHAEGRQVNHIAQWDGSQWAPLGSGVNPGGRVMSFSIFEDDLIAVGFFGHAGVVEVNGIARWDGRAWHAMGDGTGGGRAAVVYNESLVAAGTFRLPDGTERSLARWSGTSWEPIVAPCVVPTALGVFHGDLVAGGNFLGDHCAGNYVARWNGQEWASFDTGMDGPVWAVAVDEDRLYVGGNFSLAGGTPSDNIARWDEPPTPVTVMDFRVREASHEIELTWLLAQEALATLGGITVERAADAGGPYAPRSPWLVPEQSMVFRDRESGAHGVWWYRLALYSTSGEPHWSHSVAIALDSSQRITALDRVVYESNVIEASFWVGEASMTRLSLHDVRGRLVEHLVTSFRGPGAHLERWDRPQLAQGVYVVSLSAGKSVSTRKLVILR